MGLHPFAVFDAKSDLLTDARRDLWLWAEPIVADCATRCYERRLTNVFGVRALSRKHGRLWGAVIRDQASALPLLSDDLRAAAGLFGFAPDFLDATNEIVLEELMDIVLSRYRGSRSATKTYSLVLMSAASCLSTLRVAA